MDENHTLEKLRIHDRLAEVELTLARLTSHLEAELPHTMETLEALQGLVKRHEETLHGNNRPGMNVRLDRLEQTEKNRTLNLRLLWGAIIGVGAKIASDLYNQWGK